MADKPRIKRMKMSFSDSFAIGENTLQELEKGIIKNVPKQSIDLATPPPCKRKPNTAKNTKYNQTINNSNSTSEMNLYRNDFDDIIEESPTDKTALTNKSIKERLRNCSRSSAKKRHLNRSKSDPITPKRNEQQYFASMFDRPMDMDPQTEAHNRHYEDSEQENVTKANVSRDRNVFSESIDKYFQGSLECFTQLREIEKENWPKQTPSAPNDIQPVSQGLHENMSRFFQSQFTLEADNLNINVTHLEEILRTQRNLLPVLNDMAGEKANKSTEDLFRDIDDANAAVAQISFHETDNIPLVAPLSDDAADTFPTTQNMSRIFWDESDFFNDLDIRSQQNGLADQQAIENLCVNENIVVDGSIRDDLNVSIVDFIDDEIEQCKLGVSSALNEVQQTQTPMLNASTRQYSQLSSTATGRQIPLRSESQPQKKFIGDKEIDIRDMKNLSKWGFSRFILEEYKKKGIEKMFDWQAECLSNDKVRNEAHNLVYSAPTSAGKTFVSEILMIRSVVECQKKVLVILPFISVVREKMYYLQDLLRSSGIRVEGFFGGYSPPGGFDTVDIAICTIEKANSIINKLLEQKKLDSIGVIVVDEIHLISDPGRGYILELLLTKALFCSRKLGTNIQIVSMSATLPNSELLTKWLQAEYYYTDYRPVELKEMIKIGNNIYDRNMELIRTLDSSEFAQFQNDQDNVGQLCIETILEGSAVIIFCPSKDWCESLSMHVASYIYKIGKSKTEFGERLRTNINMAQIEDVKNYLKNCPTGLDAVLEKVISYGVAFHHAGLTFDERDIIESAFSNGSLRVIVATSTLSSGVNLPARRVIIRTPLFGGKQMSSLTYKQMIGRAGRTGKDTIGESILICSGNNVNAGKGLIGAVLRPLSSCLDSDNSAHLKRAILEIIAAGMAVTKDDLEAFIKSTLLYSERNFEIKYFAEVSPLVSGRKTRSGKLIKHTPADDEADPIGNCMHFLEEYEFIRLQFNEETQEMNYIATRLGHACLASSMPPSEGFLLFSELQKARQCFVMESELHAVYLVTPFSVCYQLQEIDWLAYLDMWEKLSNSMRQIGTLVGVKESFLVKAMRGSTSLDYKALQIHKRFYTALALMELVNETPINTVAIKYKFSRGVLQSLQQMTSTFAGIVTAFCRALNWEMLALIISQFQERLFFGVHQDLIDLMKISILNSQRARALHSAGFSTLIDVANANVFAIEQCLHNCISFDSKKRDGESNYEAEQRNKERSLFVTGKSGLSVKEAAGQIVQEARTYLENEMRLNNINWTRSEPREKYDERTMEPKPVINNSVSNEPTIVDANSVIRTDNSDLENAIVTHYSSGAVSSRAKLIDVEQNFIESDSEDTIHDIISFTDEPDQVESQTHLLNTSHLLNDKKIEATAAKFNHINIVDVFKYKSYFLKFEEDLEVLNECSLALSIEKVDPSIKNYSHRCAIADGVYIGGIAICIETNVAFYLNLQDNGDVDVPWVQRVAFLKSMLSRKDLTLKILDAKDQLKTLLRGLPEIDTVCCALEDPKVAHWLLQPDTESSIGRMALIYAPECLALAKIISDVKMSAVSPRYRASVEACSTLHILHGQICNLKRMDSEIMKSFQEMEMPIQKSLLYMETTGIAVDRHLMENLNLEINEHMRQLEEDMQRLNGKPFRINSRQEIARILKIGGPNVKIHRAEIEKSNHPIAKLLLQHRSLGAILSKTIQPLLRTIVDNRIYGTNISFTSTGRITMQEPNLQTVAKDFDMEFLVADSTKNQTLSCRKVFETGPSRQLISADFCQLELRILAHLSDDRTLIDIFKTQEDVFTAIAAKWNHMAASDVTEKLRNTVKQICYGIIYGMGTRSLAAAMKCDEEEAINLSESFHRAYPGIRTYTNKIIDFARQNGFVETLAGRRRYLPQINSTTDVANRNKAERQAINTKIQGSAADIAKMAMLRMERNVLKYQDRIKINMPDCPLTWVHLVLHLHDELMYEVPVDRVSNVAKILKSSMENCAQLKVPLKIKMKTGSSWGDMHVL